MTVEPLEVDRDNDPGTVTTANSAHARPSTKTETDSTFQITQRYIKVLKKIIITGAEIRWKQTNTNQQQQQKKKRQHNK
jgi:hypothetical protein